MQANEVEDMTLGNENDTNDGNDGNLGPGPNHHEEDLRRELERQQQQQDTSWMELNYIPFERDI